MKKIAELIFIIKNSLFRSKTVARYKKLLKNQDFSTDDLNAINWRERVLIVTHAYENTIFYKRFYDSYGFHPSMLENESDWDKVPVLERSMVRDHFDEIIMFNVSKRRLALSTTGGSTGHPLKVYHDKNYSNEVFAWRYLNWWGVSPADNSGTIHRRVPLSKLAILRNMILWFPTKRVFLNASSFTDEDIDIFLRKVIQKKVVRITGYVGAVEKVAEYILKKKIKISFVRHVWTTSAPLTLVARNKIEEAFGCKVMDQYGSCEVMSMAQQCPYCSGLHVNSDGRHIDIVDNEDKIRRDYNVGDILVTNMESFAFPLIKYRLGDRSNYLASDHRKCDLPFPLINFVSGRISDTIVTPSGIALNGDYLTTIFDDYIDNVIAFQVHQKKDASIVIKVVLNNKMENNDIVLETVKTTLQQKVNREIPIQVEILDKILDDKGKTRYIISEYKN